MIPIQQAKSDRTSLAVHDAILSFGHDMPTHAQIAQVAGVSVSTVQRSIQKLCDAGMLKWEQRFQANKQVSNVYHIPTSIDPLMVGQNDRAIYTYVSEEVVVEEDSSVDLYLEDVLETSSLHHTMQSMPLRGMRGYQESQVAEESPGDGGMRWLFDYTADIARVADRFADHLELRDGKIRDEKRRRRKWFDTAFTMLVEQRLAVDEVLSVIDYSFAHIDEVACEVYCDLQDKTEMPHWDHWYDKERMKVDDWHPVLTRLVQIQRNYDLILRYMDCTRVEGS